MKVSKSILSEFDMSSFFDILNLVKSKKEDTKMTIGTQTIGTETIESGCFDIKTQTVSV